ncbi:MAG: 16S rRNA (cytosine(1402)-N(4))-methyltransferase RsmH [Deltaproteobacteria bacterium]|nr:16S rRNA (cytosine(1402)-N(4))-methyltransferase RsmH [Deltaproteobacteria bacterium]
MREYLHTPVLTKEVIKYLKCSGGGTFVDATVGEGGHALDILRASQQSRVIGIDWDEEILEKARKRLVEYSERVTLIHDDFVHLPHILRGMGIKTVDGLLFDLGVSTFHFKEERRGFSFQKDGLLDMRMDKRRKLTAYNIVNHFSLEEIEEILKRYGEERWAKRIAKAIGEKRRQSSIQTTTELAEIASQAIPKQYRPRRVHPATKTFLALRIAVNEELKKIEEVLKEAPLLLKRGGRICVISFHSLEDRIVKEGLKRMESTCICPPTFPQCVCGGREKVLQIITKKPLTPPPEEMGSNPQARSAKLRVAERV